MSGVKRTVVAHLAPLITPTWTCCAADTPGNKRTYPSEAIGRLIDPTPARLLAPPILDAGAVRGRAIRWNRLSRGMGIAVAALVIAAAVTFSQPANAQTDYRCLTTPTRQRVPPTFTAALSV